MTITNSFCCNPCEKISSFVQSRSEEDLGVALTSLVLFNLSPLAAATMGTVYLLYKMIKPKGVSPNEVENIYTPTSETNWPSLSQYSVKIGALKKQGNVMGITFTFDKANVLTPIYIRRNQNDERGYFEACQLSNDEPLGFAEITTYLKSNNYLASYWLGGTPKEYIGDGPIRKEVSKIVLDQVQNDSQYKNIGVILNKAIHQHFMDECEGRMVIKAVRNTHPFHYKLGFRTFNPAIGELDLKSNSRCKSHVKKHKILKEDWGIAYMHLPDHARELWLKEIQQNPIKFP